ncbi:GNAT family N-acetyltransferase [Sphingomonas bacterium]|uniref:GNAT family N-acetyltransferase n=1 Tax=Sphingomonas bacterium TaxID=1895847 RepID=UPI00157613EE|nr:GNAT family N-acetyltransferase [Sphingomonas bacterium]
MTAADVLGIRHVAEGDAAELAELLNAIIAQGGTTALEQPFTPEGLAQAHLTGPSVYCCFVAVDPKTGRIEGFQTLGHSSSLTEGIGDIATFTRIDGKQRGIGTALFAITRAWARDRGLTAINATIRVDNEGGLAFYDKQGFIDHDVSKAVPLQTGTLIDRVHKRYAL